MTSKSNRLRIIFTSLATLAIGQVIWWAYLLITTSNQQGTRFTTMILSESTFFIAVWSLAMWSAFRFTQEQAGLRRSHSDFLSAITHELKTPLANVQLSLDTLERPNLDEEMRLKYIKRGQTALARLLREIETVLVMTNSEMSSRQIQSVSLKDLVEPSVALAQEAIGEPGQIKIEGDLSVRVLASTEETRLILQSLIDNAMKYHAPAQEATVTIRAFVTSNGRHVQLDIIDRGVGLSEDEIQNVFQPFWRSENSKSEAKSGTGLGLAFARSLAERTKLKIHLKSPGLGQGTTATVTFPRGEA